MKGTIAALITKKLNNELTRIREEKTTLYDAIICYNSYLKALKDIGELTYLDVEIFTDLLTDEGRKTIDNNEQKKAGEKS